MSLITWNPDDKKSDIILSNNNLTATTASTLGMGQVRATKKVPVGKWYWEILVGAGNIAMIGVTEASYSINRWYMSRGLRLDNGRLIIEENYLDYTNPIHENDIVGVAIDTVNGTLEFFVNGVSLGVAFDDLLSLEEIYPVFADGSSSSSTSVTANFGATPFQYSIPEGYLPYNMDSADWSRVTKHLIKSSNKIHTLLQDTLTYPNISEPTQEHFEQWGMDTLEGYENEISKVAYEMDEDGVLEEGRVVRKVINKNEFKINSLGVR